jgi:hypothetical protein
VLAALTPGCTNFTIATTSHDASADMSTPCLNWGAFSTPVPLIPSESVNQETDWSPAPALGTTMVFFATYRQPSGSGENLFVATRSSSTAPFDAPVLVLELSPASNSGDYVKSVGVSEDALNIMIEYNGTHYGFGELWYSHRATSDAKWSPATKATTLDNNYTVSPSISADGLRIVFSSVRAGIAGAKDIFEATRASRDADFGAPVDLSELAYSKACEENTPSLSADGLDIYFTSNRPSCADDSSVPYDIFTAHRPTLGQPFGAAKQVPELSSPMDDGSPRLSPDGTTMILNYNASFSNTGEMWIATRQCAD